jgi:hypothetical protein
MVHSLYYFGPAEVLTLVKKHGYLCAVVHEFPPDSRGKLAGGEASWVNSKGIVTMTVGGCVNAYVHEDLLWLRSGGSWSDYRGSLVWSQAVEKIGDSVIFEFRFSADVVVPDGPTPHEDLSRSDELAVNYKGRLTLTEAGGAVVPLALVKLVGLKALALYGDRNAQSVLITYAVQLVKSDKQWGVSLTNIDEVVARLVRDSMENADRIMVLPGASLLQKVGLVVLRIFRIFMSIFKVKRAIYWFWGWLKRTGLAAQVGLIVRRLAVISGVPLASLRPGAWMTIRDDTVKPRMRSAQDIGPVVSFKTPQVYADCQENELTSLANRALSSSPVPGVGAWDDLTKWYLKWEHVLLPTRQVNAVKYEDWNRRFPPARQVEHNRAKANVETMGLSRSNLKQWTIRKSFIKRELMLDELEDKDPRLIQGVPAEANVLLSPWVYAFSEYVKEVWGLEHPVTYASGMDAIRLGRWMVGRQDSVLFENDFTRFDRSIGVEALSFETYVYKRHGLKGDALKVMEAQLSTAGRTAHGIEYHVEGTRKSGDPNTSCGNSLLNGLVNLYAMGKATGRDVMNVHPKEYGSCIVGGDDGVFQPNGLVDENIFESVISSLGFQPKLLKTSWPEVSFYSARWVPVEGGFVLTPKLGRLLSKFGWSLNPQANPKGWLRGVVQGHYALFYHIAFMRELFTYLLSVTKGPSIACDRTNKLSVPAVSVPDSQTRAFLGLVYDIADEDLKEFSEVIREAAREESYHFALDCALVRKLVEVDC